MRIRSHAQLNFAAAWSHVLYGVKNGDLAVPDRLPFEAQQLAVGRGPHPAPLTEHHLGPVTLVMSSKKSGTSRPLARIDPVDLVLYQALIDQLAVDIEAALPPRNVVMAYRQSTNAAHKNPCHGSPSWSDFSDRQVEIFGDPDPWSNPWSTLDRPRYAIVADIAGYFLHVDLRELERRLHAVSRQSDVILDLMDLLEAWQTLGVRGLPQGLRASSALGNLYLLPLDQLLVRLDAPFVRYMDDLVIGINTFHDARRLQDDVEKLLYNLGLTLAADKTKIIRGTNVVADHAHRRLTNEKRDFKQGLEDLLAEAAREGPYGPDPDDLPDPDDAELQFITERFDELLTAADSDADLPRGFQPLVTAILRDLARAKYPYGLEQIPRLLDRAPALTGQAASYLAAVSRQDPDGVISAFKSLLEGRHIVREQERIEVCVSILSLKLRTAPELLPTLKDWALSDPHPLVRARALLAWGAQSPADDFTVVNDFWRRSTSPWRLYALAAIQGKDTKRRNARFERWSGEGRILGEVATALRKQPLKWSRI
jgi:hypothetical protein